MRTYLINPKIFILFRRVYQNDHSTGRAGLLNPVLGIVEMRLLREYIGAENLIFTM